MTTENKTRSRRVFEEITGQGNLDAVDEVFALEFMNQALGVVGPTEVKQIVTMFRTALPDLQVTVEEQVAEDDRVVSRVTYRGTHEGPLPMFSNIAPTGKPVVLTGIYIHRHAGDRIVEVYSLLDFWGVLRQIGAVSI
ncbi:MAG: ester cyclase [Chloroflexi bacterium]|nr:ester cyclase [Chloroflexota bacterium]